MNQSHINHIVNEQNLDIFQVQAVAKLLTDGATIPFIARYRKEETGLLDEVAITLIRDKLNSLQELDERKISVIKSIDRNGHLTLSLEKKINIASTLAEVEDIYLPYKPKKRTKANIARENGLEPLANILFEQNGIDAEKEALLYIDKKKGIDSVEKALTGAIHIIAEKINEDKQARFLIRKLFFTQSILKSKVVPGMEEKGIKFKDYFDFEEPAATALSHRILAIRRGENEGVLNLSVLPPSEQGIAILQDMFVKGDESDSKQVEIAAQDCYKRLLSKSMETETRSDLKERADFEAIKIFSKNLFQLLVAPPFGAKRVMGLDPGFKTGCKIVCLDEQGKLLCNDTIFPHTSSTVEKKSAEKIRSLCKEHNIEAIAIGNGTAGRETKEYISNFDFLKDIKTIMVDESGASVYSASKIAREEFPDYDITVKGAVSIGRRLIDPLSELVKIDPKAIGVGQYQHDVNQTSLKKKLDDVVINCVNKVGVDINRASVQLLSYVSGIGPKLAKNIVEYRDLNGPYISRNQLLNVPRLGPMAYEQSAGFLRIKDGKNPLDTSAIHPESYYIVDIIANDLDCAVSDLITNQPLIKKVVLNNYVTDKVGLPTLEDIISELARPGIDPRDSFEEFSFAKDVKSVSDLKKGMKLPGIITNITAFGAFVDIGIHQDGLVHISQMIDKFIKDPSEVVKVHQKVEVTVIEIDTARNRISLSMKQKSLNQKKPLDRLRVKKQKPAKAPKPSKKQQMKNMPFNNLSALMQNKVIIKK